jgi:hypothetical protein
MASNRLWMVAWATKMCIRATTGHSCGCPKGYTNFGKGISLVDYNMEGYLEIYSGYQTYDPSGPKVYQFSKLNVEPWNDWYFWPMRRIYGLNLNLNHKPV